MGLYSILESLLTFVLGMAKAPDLQLKQGDIAPAFTALNQHGATVSLDHYLGQQVVLFFYPKDNTPGCNKEACSFRDSFALFGDRNTVVLGVSPDSVKSHVKFVEKFSLPFLLLADETKAVANAYGVWGEKTFMGRKYMGNHRVTFLIGADGRIKKIWGLVSPEFHAQEILLELQP